ncbi:hypothetical protein HAX54_037534, partial [Datura stramonium]|nr:hypothetical protein [Datura stramonium]
MKSHTVIRLAIVGPWWLFTGVGVERKIRGRKIEVELECSPAGSGEKRSRWWDFGWFLGAIFVVLVAGFCDCSRRLWGFVVVSGQRGEEKRKMRVVMATSGRK